MMGTVPNASIIKKYIILRFVDPEIFVIIFPNLFENNNKNKYKFSRFVTINCIISSRERAIRVGGSGQSQDPLTRIMI